MVNVIDLNGTWKLRWSDGVRGNIHAATREQTDPARYIDAQVPGEVHLDVWKAGWIADPYVGTNCLAARWVEECIWAYRRNFHVPPQAVRARSWLVFEGLDLNATVFLNGAEVGRHSNSFHPCRIEVTGKLRKGRNLLTVHVEGGLFGVSEKRGEGYGAHADQLLHKRHWLRKPQCQFGWDWSTRFINVGISKPVRLEWTGEAVRVDQLVPLAELSPDLRTGSVLTRWFVEGLGAKTVRGEMTVELVEAGVKTSVPVEVKPGLQACEARIKVREPGLWWPVGHGPQNLYTLRATLSVGGRRIERRTARIGFRHVRVHQDLHPKGGRYFVLEINGKKVFAKGGNFVPADMIFARLDRARYDRLTDLALEANFNILRVWGGGLYESDEFYELCDRKGILVWQEFIFACSKYPTTDEAFFQSIKAEAGYNVRRLAAHPSLIAWCGNNELEQANWHWGYDRGVVLPDHAFFHITLPRLLAEEDPTRYYQPSSPYSPDGHDPVRDDEGDQHPWSIGFANTDFRDYRKMICRFPNEGGVLGPTALPTMLACLPEGQRDVGSLAWQVHDNSVDSWAEPSHAHEIVKNWLGRPIRDFSIEEFTYWGGLLQGEALREYCDNFRRRMFDSASAIFWMFNDCWPATRSWTIVDYYLRRTPSFHFVRRALAPLSVVLAEEGGDVVVFGINETGHAVRATLRYGLFNLGGGLPRDHVVTVNLPPNASTPIGRFAVSEWKNPRSSMAFAMLTRDGELLARNRLFRPFFREMKWAKPRVRIKVEKGRAVFQSNVFAWGVCLDLDGETPLPDNFFDVYPGIPYSIPWAKRRPPKILKVGNLA
ncbi:MAG: sugar-binding domain-containing protein [Verrucomicrobiota bacterium]